MRPEIESIESIFLPELKKAQDSLAMAQTRLSELIAKKEQLINQVKQYYEALDKKPEIDLIIGTGLPDSTSVSQAAK